MRDQDGRIIGLMGMSLNINNPDEQIELQLAKNKLELFLNSLTGGGSNILTPREYDCVRGIARGQTAKEIARHYNVSHRTIETHIASIRSKLCCSSKSEIANIYWSART
jgi:DNA-binding NarL/FixJ family response regulator